MTTEEIVLDCVNNRKRLEITPNNYLKRSKVSIAVLLVITIFAGAVFIYFKGLTITTLLIAATLVGGMALLLFYFIKRTKAAAIKGDTIILNSIGDKSCVTSVRSVREIGTTSLMFVQWTRIKYNLDGATRSTFFINAPWSVKHSPELVVNKAIEFSTKKKANHKLGSVSNLAG